VGLAQDSQADVDRNVDKRALVAGSLVGLVTLDLAESCDTGVQGHVDQSTGAAATALVASGFAENASAETDGDADEILRGSGRGTRRGSRSLLGLVTLGLTENCDTGIHRNVDQSIGVAVAVQLIARSFAENASAEVDGETDEALSRSRSREGKGGGDSRSLHIDWC
jgi:hypothetical protein